MTEPPRPMQLATFHWKDIGCLTWTNGGARYHREPSYRSPSPLEWKWQSKKRPVWQQHGSGPNVHELTLNKGAEILGKVKLSELPLMSKAVRMLDEQSVSLTCEIMQDGTFEYKQIWPGKWRWQMIGYDPYLGERILAEREMLIEGLDSQDLELGASNSSSVVMQSAKSD